LSEETSEEHVVEALFMLDQCSSHEMAPAMDPHLSHLTNATCLYINSAITPQEVVTRAFVDWIFLVPSNPSR